MVYVEISNLVFKPYDRLARNVLLTYFCWIQVSSLQWCISELNTTTRSEVKRFVRDLSLITLLKKTCIIFTNIIYEKKDIDGKNIHSREIFFHDIIRYVHFKFYLQSNLNNLNDKRLIECKLIHPLIKHKSIDYINADKLWNIKVL